MKKLLLCLLISALAFTSCDDDDNIIVANAGTLTGGPFTFFVDGKEDNVSGIEVTGNVVGSNTTFVITDDTGKILGTPPNLAALQGVNFDGAGVGKCLIWYLAYQNIQGLAEGENANDFSGNFDLSNSIEVNRVAPPSAGMLTGGPFTFAKDGVADNVSGIAVTGTPVGSKKSFIITDDTGNILGLPATLADVEAENFDNAPVGKCLIWYIRYEGELEGFEAGKNANDIKGIFDLSNSIEVNRVAPPSAGMLTGGPFKFIKDGTADNVSGIAVTGTPVGSKNSFIITDDMGNILGLPPILADVEAENFDNAPAGTCLIWYIRYEGELEGFEAGKNASDIKGVFSLSNSIEVLRCVPTDAGTLTGGPFNFTVGDMVVDNVSGITITGTPVGANSSFIITDDTGYILGKPADMAALEGVNFDGVDPGKCLIWYIRYEDGLQGFEMGENANDLKGCFSLSNSIDVNRS